jgi:hypothetical protein
LPSSRRRGIGLMWSQRRAFPPVRNGRGGGSGWMMFSTRFVGTPRNRLPQGSGLRGVRTPCGQGRTVVFRMNQSVSFSVSRVSAGTTPLSPRCVPTPHERRLD